MTISLYAENIHDGKTNLREVLTIKEFELKLQTGYRRNKY